MGTCDQMPAQHCSPDRQNDDAFLRSSPSNQHKLHSLLGADVGEDDKKEEEEKEVKEAVELQMEPSTASCSRLVPAATEEEKEEEKRPEGVSAAVKEDSDSSRDAAEELQEYAYIDLQAIRKEVQCPICLGVIKKTRTVMECLHRFCRECIDKSMRMGNKECPACRTHCASRRSLRDDPRYDTLIAALFPDIERYEAEELAFCEEEKTRNKQIQASIAQIFKLQSEALGKKRASRKGIRVPSPSQRNNRGTPSRRSKRKRSGKSELESDDDEDLENIEGQTSSYSGEQYTEIDQHRQTTRRRIGSSHSFSLPSSGGSSMENKLEHKRSYPGILWNIEMRTWGKYGARSGHIRKNPQSARLAKLIDFHQNLEMEDDEYVISKTPSGADKQLLAADQSPQASHNKDCTLHPASNKEGTLHPASNIDDKGRLSEVVDQFRDRLQLSEEKKTLTGFEANCVSQGGQLLLACLQKEAL